MRFIRPNLKSLRNRDRIRQQYLVRRKLTVQHSILIFRWLTLPPLEALEASKAENFYSPHPPAARV